MVEPVLVYICLDFVLKEIYRNFNWIPKPICLLWHSSIFEEATQIKTTATMTALPPSPTPMQCFNYLLEYWSRSTEAKCLSFSWNAFLQRKEVACLVFWAVTVLRNDFWCTYYSVVVVKAVRNDICDLVRVVSVSGLPWIFHENYIVLVFCLKFRLGNNNSNNTRNPIHRTTPKES